MSSNNMKIYIIGKIGEAIVSDATRQRFERAQRMLEALGHETVNPASEEYQRQLTQLPHVLELCLNAEDLVEKEVELGKEGC